MRSWHRHPESVWGWLAQSASRCAGSAGSRKRRGLHAGWDSGGLLHQTIKKIQIFNMVSSDDSFSNIQLMP